MLYEFVEEGGAMFLRWLFFWGEDLFPSDKKRSRVHLGIRVRPSTHRRLRKCVYGGPKALGHA